MSFTADRLLLFGATGDLAQRMLLPSLCALDAEGLVDPELQIVATARSEMTDLEFRNFARAALEKYMPAERRGSMAQFLNRLHYQPLDASTVDGFDALAAKVGKPERGLAIFLSTAPSLFEPTIAGLRHAGLTGANVRIGLEKPLGTDLASSCEINDAVAAAFSEDRIFRIDHYLGKETVQNLLALRFANIMFEPIWNANYIDHVQITVAETVGLESRVAYYDDSGALRDMVQNHMLQLLALVAMEPPTSFDATRAQPNRLVIGIQPEENVSLTLMAKLPGLDREGIRLRSVPLDIAMPDAFTGTHKRIAYERLLLDLIEGDQTLFVRRDEVEAQWDWIDAIRAGWTEQGLEPKPYTAGSWGPSAAIALAERDGVTWHE
ncbi:MAG: glucose-6-phosphate dehydrogenase (NADP(+)) [Sphingomonadales bacterium]|nr:glucose-6-phosphate dehydrogenase (NADP(+)) [Sphingomonadales bacterium]